MALQPALFDLPPLAELGWRPRELGGGAHLYWVTPAEVEGRLDASYYVITRRPERLLSELRCPLSPLEAWAAINPAGQRVPAERGYLLFDDCLYAEIRDVRQGFWAIGPGLRTATVRSLPRHAAHLVQPGDLLLPRYTSSLHKPVVVQKTDQPLIVSENFILLHPHRRDDGLALLALLHHRIAGEQLWALATGTMKQAITASKLAELRLPDLAPDDRIALASQVERLLHAQTMVTFPGRQFPLNLYWMDGTLFEWDQRAHRLRQEIEQLIEHSLYQVSSWAGSSARPEEASWTRKATSAN